MSKELKPQAYWGSAKTGTDWLTKSRASESERLSAIEIPKEFEKVVDEMDSVLEVGAGDGRLISLFKKYDKRIASVDVNKKLSKYVAKTYGIETFLGDVTKKLPFKDNEFDFVYTFQVLQHIRPDDIQKALSELQRVAKKMILLTEGWGNLKKWKLPNGHKRHGAGGGTYYWNIDELIKCEETRLLMDNNSDTNNKIYKIKIYENNRKN